MAGARRRGAERAGFVVLLVLLALVAGSVATLDQRSLVRAAAVLVALASIVALGRFIAAWRSGASARSVRRVTPVLEPEVPVVGGRSADIAIDLTSPGVDPLAPIPDDRAVLEADASEIDLTRGPTVRVVLHPGPVTRRRLDGRPDALVVVADADALDVPGWIIEDRSRVIERTDRVVIPWTSIERFRVRVEPGGTQVYDITARPDAPPPRQWRVRRDEIVDELALLDHVRRVGRVTIELEDSIRS